MEEHNLAGKLTAQELSSKPAPSSDRREGSTPRIRPLQKKEKPVVLVSKRQMALTMLFISYVLVSCAGMINMRITIAEQNKQMIEDQKILDELLMENTRLQLEVDQIFTLKNIEAIAQEELGMVKEDKSQNTYVWIEKDNHIELAKDSGMWYEPFQNLFLKLKAYFVG